MVTIEEESREEDLIVESNSASEIVAYGIRKVCEILEVKHGIELSKNVQVESNLNILAGRLVPPLQTYQDRSEQVDQNATFFQVNSKFSKLREKVEEKIREIKETLENLIQNSVIRAEKLDSMTILEKRRFLEFCEKNIQVYEEELAKSFDLLFNLLMKMNLKLRKRCSNLKMAFQTKLKIVSDNSEKTWEECLDKLESQRDGIFKFTVDDFHKTKHFFEWLSRNGHEFCTPEHLLKRLNKPVEDKTYVIKVLLEHLPVIKIVISRNLTVLIDAEHFFSSPGLICDLMRISLMKDKKVSSRLLQTKHDQEAWKWSTKSHKSKTRYS